MKQCERLPRRQNARGDGAGRWHALFCAECRQALQADRKLAAGARALRREAVPRAVEQQILQRLGLPATGTAPPHAREGARRHTMSTVGVAAAMTILLGAGLAVSQRFGERTHQRDTPQITTQRGTPISAPPHAVSGPPARNLVQISAPPLPGVRTSVRFPPPAQPLAPFDADSTPPSANHARTVSRSNGTAPGIIPDDLEYLNDRPLRDRDRWAAAAPDTVRRVEEQLRNSIRLSDDFVTIPFPRLAAAGARQIAQAAESYRREAAIVDPRLAREVTVAAKAMALVDLCEQLRADTGIHLAAGRSVADEKVSLFCRKLPLRDVMRQLSRPFGYTWLRSGSPSPSGTGEPRLGRGADSGGGRTPGAEGRGYRYELVQDLKSQLLEEELRNSDRNEALVALDREMGQFRPYLAITPEQARARLKNAPAAEKPLLEKLAGGGWGAIQMYFRLSPRDLAALRAGQTLKFSTQPGQGEQPLPAEVASGIEQIQPPRPRGGAEAPDGPGGQVRAEIELRRTPRSLPMLDPTTPRSEVQLSIEPSELGTFSLVGGSGRLTPAPDGMMMWMSRDNLAVGRSPSVMRPQNAVANAKLARDPALQKRITAAPGASRQSLGVGGAERRQAVDANRSPTDSNASRLPPNDLPKTSSAEILEALHRATGMPIVADFYTRLYPLPSVTVKDQPLFQVLNGLADTMRLRWNKENGWLQFRSVGYFHDRLKEVPNRLLNRWAASRRARGYLTLDELIEIAQLSDAQLDAAEMGEGVRFLWGLAEWDLARGRAARPHLRLLASFSPAQRQAVAGRDGLPFTQLTLVQQQQFITLALGGQADDAGSLADLAEAALRVDYSAPGSYEWSSRQAQTGDVTLPGDPPGGVRLAAPELSGPPAVRERSREAALAAARRIDPSVTEAQIVPSQGALTIVYTTAGPNGRVPLLALRATGNSANVTANRVQRRGEGETAPP